MTEDFIHFIWKFRLYQKELKTTNGEKIVIISPGIHNSDAGPDFFNVKLKINETIWVGNAEVHICSSDWEKHQHYKDGAYNNVVLHIVYEHDKQIRRSDGTEPPTLELKDFIKAGLEEKYEQLTKNLLWIPCEKQIGRIEELHLNNWLYRMLIERLEEKSQLVNKIVEDFKGSWDDTFYVLLARNFGFKINALPFELLARSLPQQILAKHKGNIEQTEALLFGQAGFLREPEDEYSERLAKEYDFLRKKYHLKPVDSYLWKFLRLRPQNFPTLRIAQFAALISRSSRLFSTVLEIKDVKKMRALFKDLPVGRYWESHYRLSKRADRVSNQLGDDSINSILLNTIVPMIFSYGKYTINENLVSHSVDILENLPFETNSLTAMFKNIGVKAGNAGTSQALIQLKKSWCDRKKCLNCAVGAKIINSDQNDTTHSRLL